MPDLSDNPALRKALDRLEERNRVRSEEYARERRELGEAGIDAGGLERWKKLMTVLGRREG